MKLEGGGEGVGDLFKECSYVSTTMIVFAKFTLVHGKKPFFVKFDSFLWFDCTRMYIGTFSLSIMIPRFEH